MGDQAHCRVLAFRLVPFSWCTPQMHSPTYEKIVNDDSSDHITFFHIFVHRCFFLYQLTLKFHLFL